MARQRHRRGHAGQGTTVSAERSAPTAGESDQGTDRAGHRPQRPGL